jgi:hypothetical protein
MIDLADIAALFFEASKEWREPQAVRLHLLSAIEHEPVYRHLNAEGHEMCWVNDARVRQCALEGWRPVTERDAIRRPIIFMDNNGELVFMHRESQSLGKSGK